MSNPSETNATILAMEYLKLLQEGRTKPDKNGRHSFVRESIDNTESIKTIRKLLDKYFENELRCTEHPAEG